MKNAVFLLLGAGVGAYVAVLGILFLRQGCAYIPSSRFREEEWVVDRESNPIFFWIVTVGMVILGVSVFLYNLTRALFLLFE